MKTFTLCADDYGYNEAVSNGIITLIQQGRLSATSCITNSSAWPSAAITLSELSSPVEVGLHFNLTEGEALCSQSSGQFAPLAKLLPKAFLRRLNYQAIVAELRAQLEAFIKAMGRRPDFIDGHQHIHQLPVVRAALLTVYQEYFPDKQAAIRISGNTCLRSIRQSLRCPKILIIALTGALTLKKQLEQANIPHNTSFSGVYDLAPNRNYTKLFHCFLNEINDQGLIMCHPADESTDSIGAARQQEFDFFKSARFVEALQAHHAQLKNGSHTYQA